MKKLYFIKIFFILFVYFGTPSFSQDFGWAIDDDSGFFPIGWSKDGTHFAYGSFSFSKMIADSSHIFVTIQNIITDERVWDYNKSWEESNVGNMPGHTEIHAPETAKEAWMLISKEVSAHLSQFNIEIRGLAKPENFPLKNGDEINTRIEQLDNNNFEVFAISKNMGIKKVSKFNSYSLIENLSIKGFLRNPEGSRIAIIIEDLNYSLPFRTYNIIGCHLKAGFKKIK